MTEAEQTLRDDKAALLGELQHRVRNTLGTMRALIRRSAETSMSLDEYVMHLEGRLDAMGRVQNAFLRNPIGGIDLGLLIADELATVGAREGERVSIEGPPIVLHPRAAEPLGLALHELTVNALKFGALGTPAGRIAVTWRFEARDDGRHLLFDWVETGAPLTDTTPPSHRGFGRTVLEEMLPHNLRARTTLAFTPQGLSCWIDLPVTERVLAVGR